MRTSQIDSAVFGRIDDLHLSVSERLKVNAYLQDGEFIAELFCHLLALIHSGTRGLARAIKAMFAGSAWR
jgi:hypothetical protein